MCSPLYLSGLFWCEWQFWRYQLWRCLPSPQHLVFNNKIIHLKTHERCLCRAEEPALTIILIVCCEPFHAGTSFFGNVLTDVVQYVVACSADSKICLVLILRWTQSVDTGGEPCSAPSLHGHKWQIKNVEHRTLTLKQWGPHQLAFLMGWALAACLKVCGCRIAVCFFAVLRACFSFPCASRWIHRRKWGTEDAICNPPQEL